MKSMAQTLVQSDKLKVSCTSPIYSKGSCALRQYFGFIAELRLGKLASGVPWVRFLGYLSVREILVITSRSFALLLVRQHRIRSSSKDDGYGTKQEYYRLKKEKCSCCTCNTNFRAFLCRTPQNNNEKSPNFRF